MHERGGQRESTEAADANADRTAASNAASHPLDVRLGMASTFGPSGAEHLHECHVEQESGQMAPAVFIRDRPSNFCCIEHGSASRYGFSSNSFAHSSNGVAQRSPGM
jgi:hypothetical protein